jgi:hypothetical protein
MNTCGINHYHIYSQFLLNNYHYTKEDIDNTVKVEKLLEMITQEWHFSEYYDILVNNNINTPYSEFINVKELTENPNIINQQIQQFKNSHVFARTDSCSSKPSNPFKSAEEILDSLKKSDRTSCLIKNPNCRIVLREYIEDINNYYEFRCFVHNNEFRGLTSSQPVELFFNVTSFLLEKIIKLVKKVTYYTEYDMCTIDIAINKFDYQKEIIVIEINTPVWLCATSGLFDLTDSYDYEVLLGKYNPEIIRYPIIKIDYLS